MDRMRGMKGRWGRLALAGAWLLCAPTALASGNDVALREATCSFPAMIDDLRAALKTGSPTFKLYMRTLLKEAALAMPPEALLAAYEQERDPAVLEVLGVALATKSSNINAPQLIRPLLSRAMKDADPSLRAAALRGLRGTGSVELIAKHADLTSYEQLIRDPAPEVRLAVVENIIEENAKVYYGHHAPVTEAAVAVAVAAPTPELAAKLLREVSLEQAGAEAVSQVTRQLKSDDPNLRTAAAMALGGVPSTEASSTKSSLVELYRGERSPAVRKAILQSIARLGFAGSVPVLESLRGVDSSLAPEIDAWIKALRLPLQEWSMIQREKERLLK